MNMNRKVLLIALSVSIMSAGLNASQQAIDTTIHMQIKEAMSAAASIKSIRTKANQRTRRMVARIMEVLESLKPMIGRTSELHQAELTELAATMKEAADDIARVKSYSPFVTQSVVAPAPVQPVVQAPDSG